MTFNIYNYIEDPTVSEMVRYQARMYTQLMHGGEMFRPVSRIGKSRFWALGKNGRKVYTDGSYASLEAYRRSYGFEPVDRVDLPFGLWEQAEARHKNDVAKQLEFDNDK